MHALGTALVIAAAAPLVLFGIAGLSAPGWGKTAGHAEQQANVLGALLLLCGLILVGVAWRRLTGQL